MAPHLGAGQQSLPSRSDRSGIQGARSCRNQDEQLNRAEHEGMQAGGAKCKRAGSMWRGRRGRTHVCCDAPWRFILTCLRRLNLSPLPYKTQQLGLRQKHARMTSASTIVGCHPVHHLLMQLQVTNCEQALPAALARHVGTAASVNMCERAMTTAKHTN